MNNEHQPQKGFTREEITEIWDSLELLNEYLTSNRLVVIEDEEEGIDEPS